MHTGEESTPDDVHVDHHPDRTAQFDEEERPVCRNITELRGLEPAATEEEVAAAARQYIRKVTGIRAPNPGVTPAYEAAVAQVAELTAGLLAELPTRRQPPKTVPPLRRPQVRTRMGLPPFDSGV